MPTDTELAYLELPADARMEVRLPALLKEHAELVAATRSEKLSQLVVEALAEKVSEELATVRTWKLTVPEQTELLRVLSAKTDATPALSKATQRAAKLFGEAAVR
jgi:uncharacterized protein (DUF1778 family)